jgi:tol-pal system protein YbgF
LSGFAGDAKSTGVLSSAQTWRAGGVLIAVLGLAGCATQADLQDIRREHRGIRSQLADTRATVEAMQRDVEAMRGKMDEVRHANRGRREEDTRLEGLEARLAALEGRGTQAPATTAPPPDPWARPEATQPQAPGSDLATEEAKEVPEDYRRGLTLVKQGSYDRAIQAFRDFLRANADSPLAANAHYWIGECYYLLGDYSQAILKFNDVRQQYPRSDRVAPSLLKIGLAFLQMGNKSEARLAFQKVVNDYPASPEATQAREKLQALGA